MQALVRSMIWSMMRVRSAGARDHPAGLDVPAAPATAGRSGLQGMDGSSPRRGIRFHCAAGSSAAPSPGPAAGRGGGGGVRVRRRGGAGGLRWRPRPGHVASGKQRHRPASVRRGLPERAAVRGGGRGGHHPGDRRRRPDLAGAGQSAARVIGAAVRDRLRRAGFLLCHRPAGCHLGRARRRRLLEPACAARRGVRRGPDLPACLALYPPFMAGRPAACRLGLLDIACVSARVCYAVSTAPAAYPPTALPATPHAAASSIRPDHQRDHRDRAAHPDRSRPVRHRLRRPSHLLRGGR